MRILLFAYEFPPIVSAQSLRWYYLANELARLGAEINVITPAIRDLWGFTPDFHPGVRIHRCFPGPFVGISGRLAARLTTNARHLPNTAPGGDVIHQRRSLVDTAYRRLRQALDQVLLPDVRTEWLPFAWRTATRLFATQEHDVIISSHEPGVDLLLGLRAQRTWRKPWVTDLADPLVTPYCPRWRTHWDAKLERKVCQRSNVILVTAERAAERLAAQHQVPASRFVLIRQGFDHRDGASNEETPPPWPPGTMVFLFTGSLYQQFREPSALISAISQLPGATFVFVGDMGAFHERLAALQPATLVLGKQPHACCLSWQRQADVLINIGNQQDDQIPGKLYEYLGSGRPILHIASSPSDPAVPLIRGLARGITVAAEQDAVTEMLKDLHQRWIRGALDHDFDLTPAAVIDYSWSSSAQRVHRVLSELTPKALPTERNLETVTP